MTRLVEAQGCFVIKWSFDIPDVDGLSMYEPDLGLPPIIVVDPSFSGDRLRFTIAHELAHIILHHHLALPGDDAESEADEFASEFMMPHAGIRPFLRGNLTIDKLGELKAHWKMSMAAILTRAHDLDAITDSQRSRLWATMNRMGFVKKEPVAVPVEEPALLSGLTQFHMGRLGYSPDEMCAALSMDRDEFQRFVGAPARGPLRVIR